MTRCLTLITGASSGIGADLARVFAAEGHRLALVARRRERLDALADEIVAAGGTAPVVIPCDLTHPDAGDLIADALASAGVEVDHLVNNAGLGAYTYFADTTPEQLDQLYRVHVRAPFLLTQALVPMISTGGSVLFVSSGLARFTLPGYSAYAAMKGAVEVLTRYVARELGERGIRANVLAPGAVATDFGGGAVRDNADLNALVASTTALGRVGEADDIGAAVVALLSDAMRWTNGTRVEVSGGQSL